MLFGDNGNFNCLEKLKSPAKSVVREGFDIVNEDFEERVALWNKIRKNYNLYKEGHCGEFLDDIDRATRRTFEWALGVLAYSFYYNNEHFPALNKYKEKELELIGYILKYNVFEIWSVDDIVREIMNAQYKGFDETLSLLKEYYNGIGDKVDECIKDHTIRLYIRDFAKEKWLNYKEKMDKAISEGMKYDWFRRFIEGVNTKIRELESRIHNLGEFIERERGRLEEDFENWRNIEKKKIEFEREQLKKEFEREKERLIKEIEDLKEKEMRNKLELKLKEVEEEYKSIIDELNELLKLKDEEIKRIEQEKKEVEEKFDRLWNKIRLALEEERKLSKDRIVRLEEASFYEIWFVDRLRKKLSENKTIKVNGRRFKVYKDEIVETKNKNTEITALMEERKLNPLTKKMKIMFRGIYFTHVEEYNRDGFDTYPMSLGEVKEIIEKAKINGKEYDRVILLIASPTGFDNKTKEIVSSDDLRERYLSDKISLSLFDVKEKKLYYNEVDEFCRAFAKLMSLEFEDEEIMRCKKRVKEEVDVRSYVTFEDIVNEFSKDVVREVFYKLEKTGNYEVKFIKDVGLVLIKK
ncbi:hypothetical protein [Methanotorris formicicus]|uniref:Uncharacterized protein n=1 Tax=Methanotorris formicicus Mc-S-70 TaxID=647171 RepID=H1L1A1_9EURY|nr:hypothetical protein [Methanotorris formicicus]EHP83914.1 hypothetical protein MetfoDRAFT_1825 [Methanotorris formicicus Mc-S-70]